MYAKLIKISGTAAVAALSLIAAQANARPAALVHVTMTGLDLSTAEGQAAADTRISNAAREVCTVQTATPSYLNRIDADCYRTAVKTARAQLETMTAQRAGTTELAARR